MSVDFMKYTQKGNEFLNRLAVRLGDPHNRDRVGRVLKAVLHGIRNNISVHESLHLLAQLPVALKDIYVDGWQSHEPRKHKHLLIEFIEEVSNDEIYASGMILLHQKK